MPTDWCSRVSTSLSLQWIVAEFIRDSSIYLANYISSYTAKEYINWTSHFTNSKMKNREGTKTLKDRDQENQLRE